MEELVRKGWFLHCDNVSTFNHVISIAWMRFGGDGCAYSDDLTWFSKEVVAYYRNSGLLSGSYTTESQLKPAFDYHKAHGGCVYRTGGWTWFEVTLAFGVDYLHFDWWNTEWRTWYPFSATARFTSTTK